MAEKSAENHTFAPRLSYVEDLANWLKDNRGEGGGTDPSELLKKLYHSTIGFSHTGSGSFSTDIWDEDSVYKDPYGERSLHVAVFGFGAERRDLTNVEMCLAEARGFYNQVFAVGDNRWAGAISDLPSFATDVFGHQEEYLGSLRTSGRSLVEAIFKDPSYIPSGSASGTVMGRIEQLENDLEELATNFEEALGQLQSEMSSRLDDIESALSNIFSRLNAAGI